MSSDLLSVPTGRVVRLYFECHAELPIGSSLRVTGSSLWAPTANGSPSDPMNAHHIAQEHQQHAAFAGAVDDADYWYDHPTNLYTSSVEMVTTPETYPLWTTKQPVIVVLHANGNASSCKTIQHHYYRYLVVTPGAGTEDAAVVATGNDASGTSSPVMMWEQPFGPVLPGPIRSNQSLGSSHPLHDNADDSNTLWHLAQLPYRTLDIQIETALVVSPDAPDDRVVDTWNHPEDSTFRAYQIRKSMTLDANPNNNPNNNNANHPPPALSSLNSLASAGAGAGDGAEDASMMTGDAASTTSTTPTTPTTPTTLSDPNTPSVAPKILFICFHLPVVVVKVNGQWQASWSESLLAQKEGSKIVATYRAHWIGTVTPHPPITNDTDRQAVRDVLAALNCTPIFLNPSTRQAHYYGFCKQVLWPAFHNIDLLDLSTSGVGGGGDPHSMGNSDWDQSRLDHWWQAYQQVNQEFATVVNALVDRDSSTYLWIHDYHLSLLPRCLNQEPAKSCRKVFFLHIPFPTSQIFRELECGEDILQGMLHADVVGFHAFDHARHFLNAAKRILGLNYESLVGGLIGVNYLGKTVLVSMSNVSIESKMADGTCSYLY
jgi:hypothetical protein